MSRTAARGTRAKIDLDGGICCLMINWSETKGILEVAVPFSLPNEFEITIEGES